MNIPSKIWTGSTLEHLDIAARYFIAGCLPSPAIAAKPTNTPPIPALPAVVGIPPALLAHFSYLSKAESPTSYRSKFSLLLPVRQANLRLAAILSAGIFNPDAAAAEILAMPGVVAPVSLVPSLYNLVESSPDGYTGISTLEGVIYKAAVKAQAENIGLPIITPIAIANVPYLKIGVDFAWGWSGAGAAGG
jgi:hypothetical protein